MISYALFCAVFRWLFPDTETENKIQLWKPLVLLSFVFFSSNKWATTHQILTLLSYKSATKKNDKTKIIEIFKCCFFLLTFVFHYMLFSVHFWSGEQMNSEHLNRCFHSHSVQFCLSHYYYVQIRLRAFFIKYEWIFSLLNESIYIHLSAYKSTIRLLATFRKRSFSFAFSSFMFASVRGLSSECKSY